MAAFLNLFRVDAIAFEVFNYPLSYIELVSTLLYLWSVWLIARRNIWTWPIGMASVILYAVLFYQIQLYSDAGEQVYYIFTSIYGWSYWARHQPPDKQTVQGIILSSWAVRIYWGSSILAVTIILGIVMTKVHIWLPAIFPQPAAFPFLDALTTVMSFSAMFLMAQKRIESWVYWIMVDVIGIGLYFTKQVKFVSLVYVVLLGIAIYGYCNWRRNMAESANQFELGKVNH